MTKDTCIDNIVKQIESYERLFNLDRYIRSYEDDLVDMIDCSIKEQVKEFVYTHRIAYKIAERKLEKKYNETN